MNRIIELNRYDLIYSLSLAGSLDFFIGWMDEYMNGWMDETRKLDESVVLFRTTEFLFPSIRQVRSSRVSITQLPTPKKHYAFARRSESISSQVAC